MTRKPRRCPVTLEQLDARICPVGVPVVLTTMSLAFTPVSMSITNTVPKTTTTTVSPVPAGKETLPYLDTVPTPTKPVNDWVPPLDQSNVPLVPGGPG